MSKFLYKYLSTIASHIFLFRPHMPHTSGGMVLSIFCTAESVRVCLYSHRLGVARMLSLFIGLSATDRSLLRSTLSAVCNCCFTSCNICACETGNVAIKCYKGFCTQNVSKTFHFLQLTCHFQL